MEKEQVLCILLMAVCMTSVQTCSIDGFFEMNVMEKFVQADNLVYGRTIQHAAKKRNYRGQFQYVINAIFEVHCIFKQTGEVTLTEQITIEAIAPGDGCSGTKATSMMKVGDYAIVALRKSSMGAYSLHEVMPVTSAAVLALKPYFFSIANICHLQSWMTPANATVNRCPICGTSDFDPEVQELDNSLGLVNNCPHAANSIVTNMTGCDLYMADTIDWANLQTCVPASFNQTCVNLLYRAPTTTCDCRPKKPDSYDDIGAGSMQVPNKLITASLLAVWFAVMLINIKVN